jgi:hypothetical protein
VCLLHVQNETDYKQKVVIEKLIVPQAAKEFPSYNETRWFITAFTTARHFFLSRTRLLQSTFLGPLSLRSILILSSHLHLGVASGHFPHFLHSCVCISSIKFALKCQTNAAFNKNASILLTSSYRPTRHFKFVANNFPPEDSILLECYAVSLDKELPTFRSIVRRSSSKVAQDYSSPGEGIRKRRKPFGHRLKVPLQEAGICMQPL